ncbi:Sodium/hydrogen exchanger [Gracilaria domingensis]|nr:Sodium/hydrogen exchanger [Gracilaria domingensis]
METELDLVRLGIFLSSSYASGELASHVGTSPIAMYIVVGALLGPPLANFVPVSAGVKLAGLLGILLSVVDAGIGTRMEDLKKSLARALLVAVLGVAFPIAGAVFIVCISEVMEDKFTVSNSLKTAFAVGSAIAPTSLGVTARLLHEIGELETKLGQLISVAAVFDDVISLILLSQITAVAAPDPNVWTLCQPVVFSLMFIVGASAFAILLPQLLPGIWVKAKVPEQYHPLIGIWLLLLLVIAITYIAYLAKTSFLLGGYLIGIAFSQVPSSIARDQWNCSVAVYIEWLSLLFFAGTIGFVIPLTELFSWSAIRLGALLSLSSVVGKMMCGLGMFPNQVDGIAVAIAMLGRGEFGFLIASQAQASGLLSQRIYAATTWGVLVPTIIAPIAFRPVFRWRKNRIDNREADTVSHTSDPLSQTSSYEQHD